MTVGRAKSRRDGAVGQAARQLHTGLRVVAAAATLVATAACGPNAHSAAPPSAASTVTAPPSAASSVTAPPSAGTASTSTPTLAPPAPDPDLASVVPARYILVSRNRVTLTPNLPGEASSSSPADL